MQKHLKITIGCLCLLGLATGCVRQNDYATLQQRVQAQDQQLRQLQPAQADAWAQVQTLRQEVNMLKGQLDDLQNAGGAKALVDRVQRHDAALRQVESALAVNLNLDAPMGMSPMTTGASTALAPTPLTGSEAMAATGTPPASSGTMVLSPPSQQLTPPNPNKEMDQALYEAGVSAYSARKYTEAERSFSDLTSKYPKSSLAANAVFYLGECNFQRNKFADAALEYEKVITKYKGSSRAPSAYLKQGICFSKLGQTAAARARMQELIRKYPNSAEATRAKTFLKTNK